MTKHLRNSRVRAALAAVTVAALVGLAGCSGSGSDDSASADAGSGGSSGDMAPAAPEDAADFVDGASDGSGGGNSTVDRSPIRPIDLQQSSIIKTAAIELESDDIADVITKIEGLVLTTGGRISSEDTATNQDGDEVRSRIELQVPVTKFDEAYNEIPTYGTLVDKKKSEEDVTGQVADVNSRVESAKDSIDQLRELFSQATKLGDVITLERELSQRQADLEALQAQQRSLNDQTTMSTILVSIGTPEVLAKEKDEKQEGFVAGIKTGWDGMVTFVVGTSHGLGLVLPLGSLLLGLGLVVWLLVRRFMPRPKSPVQPQPSPVSSE